MLSIMYLIHFLSVKYVWLNHHQWGYSDANVTDSTYFIVDRVRESLAQVAGCRQFHTGTNEVNGTLLTHVYSSHTMNWVPNFQHRATPSKSLKMALSRKMTPLQKTPVPVSILCTIYDTGLPVINYCVTVVHCEVIEQTDHSPTHLFPMFSEQKEAVWHMCGVLEKRLWKVCFLPRHEKVWGTRKEEEVLCEAYLHKPIRYQAF